jgi:hypothetical protein
MGQAGIVCASHLYKSIEFLLDIPRNLAQNRIATLSIDIHRNFPGRSGATGQTQWQQSRRSRGTMCLPTPSCFEMGQAGIVYATHLYKSIAFLHDVPRNLVQTRIATLSIDIRWNFPVRSGAT